MQKQVWTKNQMHIRDWDCESNLGSGPKMGMGVGVGVGLNLTSRVQEGRASSGPKIGMTVRWGGWCVQDDLTPRKILHATFFFLFFKNLLHKWNYLISSA